MPALAGSGGSPVTTPAISAVVVHRRPADGDGDHLVRFQRAMLWVRLLVTGIVLTQGWLYQMVHPAILWLAVGIELAVMASQGRLLADGVSRAALHRRAIALLVADLVAVYILGTLDTPDQAWIGYYFYPLLSLEATLIAGVWAGVIVTGMSVVVYLAQLVLYVSFGHAAEPRSALAAVTLIAMTGGFVTLYAHMARRGHDHLRALLSLTSELARHETQSQAIRHIDRRLHEAIGARIRSVVVRDVDGQYRITRWQTGEQRILTPEQLLHVFDDAGDLAKRLEAGDAVTVETDPWSLVTAALGLPEWASALTLVPIVAEGRWAGMLPVLWPTRTIPDGDQLRLLHGLAGQIGLALARGELEQMRRDATVDPLTGLLNRRAIGAELQAFVARAARSGGPLAVLLLELDRDGLAIDPADATLRSVAVAIRGVLRNGDVAGRQDVDRLLVIAADADADAARTLAGRITAEIASVPGAESLRFAIGIAALPDDGPSASDLVEAADAALAVAAPRSPAHAYLAGDQDEVALA
jgi:diguanylate cyclase (GGDEF)-like protein